MLEESFKRDQVIQIIGSVIHRVAKTPVDAHLMNELDSLKSAIDHLNNDLNLANPEHIHSHIPNATSELDAIVVNTEAATHTIITSCETIQKLLTEPTSRAIETELTKIIEACTFQDLTGQRISKIIRSLHEIDKHANDLSKVLKSRFADLHNTDNSNAPNNDPLLNGPQLPGHGISQEEIDALLNDFK